VVCAAAMQCDCDYADDAVDDDDECHADDYLLNLSQPAATQQPFNRLHDTDRYANSGMISIFGQTGAPRKRNPRSQSLLASLSQPHTGHRRSDSSAIF